MKKILQVSTECFPAAKAGGMGDVVGALPIYLPQQGIQAAVVLPKYGNAWFAEQAWTTVKKSSFQMADIQVNYRVQKLKGLDLGYPFYCIDLPGLFDRPSIYLAADGNGYKDEPIRNIAFQTAVAEWLTTGRQSFDGLHCHDHMTGLIPFMMKYCPRYVDYKEKPVLFTIHNGEYRGVWDWSYGKYLPKYDPLNGGVLDWDGQINGLATAIKTAWHINTVSPAYMREIMKDSDTLTRLYHAERYKCTGILNGIDNELWNPATDQYLDIHLEGSKWAAYKKASKSHLLKLVGLKGAKKPLIGFIGRMAWQKGADILAASIEQVLAEGHEANFVILGSGDKQIEADLLELATKYKGTVSTIIAYDEKLARAIYAGCDYLAMPSRFEPCGLNQMYAMRYGTVPIVTKVGGLIDTVPDISNDGNGILCPTPTISDFTMGVRRAISLYLTKEDFTSLRDKLVALDFSWSASAEDYAHLYEKYS